MFESGQQRSLLEGRLKLDSGAKYTIGFRASSGHYFNWAFSDYAGRSFSHSVHQPGILNTFKPAEFGAIFAAVAADHPGSVTFTDVPSNGWDFYTRELYASATPVKAVTVEFGSFGIERGLSTEITTFDDDGYLVGERIRLHDPRHLSSIRSATPTASLETSARRTCSHVERASRSSTTDRSSQKSS